MWGHTIRLTFICVLACRGCWCCCFGLAFLRCSMPSTLCFLSASGAHSRTQQDFLQRQERLVFGDANVARAQTVPVPLPPLVLVDSVWGSRNFSTSINYFGLGLLDSLCLIISLDANCCGVRKRATCTGARCRLR